MQDIHPSLLQFHSIKRFRICLNCPFFCRMEERIKVCPWCELPLIAACPCGGEIADPTVSGCAHCGKNLRPDPRLEQTRELVVPFGRRR
jgi:hypothetical protein